MTYREILKFIPLAKLSPAGVTTMRTVFALGLTAVDEVYRNLSTATGGSVATGELE